MSDIEDVTERLNLVQRFLKILSWKKIFQLFLLILIIGVSFGLFENRITFYSYLSNLKFGDDKPRVYRISEKTVKEIDDLVNQAELINGIQIVVVDFDKNTRSVVHVTFDDEKLKLAYQKYTQGSIADIPLFNSDTANNLRLSRIINGDFVCTPFKETHAYTLVPAAESAVDTLCSNGIPPYYGKFIGVLSFYLTRKPIDNEVDQLRALSRALSTVVFERDFR